MTYFITKILRSWLILCLINYIAFNRNISNLIKYYYEFYKSLITSVITKQGLRLYSQEWPFRRHKSILNTPIEHTNMIAISDNWWFFFTWTFLCNKATQWWIHYHWTLRGTWQCTWYAYTVNIVDHIYNIYNTKVHIHKCIIFVV